MNTEEISEKIKGQIKEFMDEGCNLIRVRVSFDLYKKLTGVDPVDVGIPERTIHGVPLYAVDFLKGYEYVTGGRKQMPQTQEQREIFLRASAESDVKNFLNSARKSK